jgi:hypothetical protein
MTTIGKKWRAALVQVQASSAEEQASAQSSLEKSMAAVAIREIPGLIDDAKGAASVCVFECVTSKDVAGSHSENVEKLYARLGRGKRPLRAGDLAGRAKIVFEWCDTNDLDCFLVKRPAGFDEADYDFHVRPKL